MYYSLIVLCFLLINACALPTDDADRSASGTTSAALTDAQRLLCAEARPVLNTYVNGLNAQSGLGQALGTDVEIWQLPYAEGGRWNVRELAVRWYEKGRVEYHPDLAKSNDPVKRAYGVQLGRLGWEMAWLHQRVTDYVRSGAQNGQADYAQTTVPALASGETIPSVFPKDGISSGVLLEQCVTDAQAYQSYGWAQSNPYIFGYTIHNDIVSAWNQPGVSLAHEVAANISGAIQGDTFESKVARRGHPISPFCKFTTICSLHGAAYLATMKGTQFFERSRFEVVNENRNFVVKEANIGRELYESRLLIPLITPSALRKVADCDPTATSSTAASRPASTPAPAAPAAPPATQPPQPSQPPNQPALTGCDALVATLGRPLASNEACTLATFLGVITPAENNGGILVSHVAVKNSNDEELMESMSGMFFLFSPKEYQPTSGPKSVHDLKPEDKGTQLYLVLRKIEEGELQILRASRK